MRVGVRIVLSKEAASAAIRVERAVMGKKIGESTVRYPADWWEALKARWFPYWWLRVWPVRETVYDLSAYLLYPEFEPPRIGRRGAVSYAVLRQSAALRERLGD